MTSGSMGLTWSGQRKLAFGEVPLIFVPSQKRGELARLLGAQATSLRIARAELAAGGVVERRGAETVPPFRSIKVSSSIPPSRKRGAEARSSPLPDGTQTATEQSWLKSKLEGAGGVRRHGVSREEPSFVRSLHEGTYGECAFQSRESLGPEQGERLPKP